MRKKLSLLCTISAVLAINFPAGPVAAAGSDLRVPPPADDIVIDVITTNGSGCAPGTTTVTMLPGNYAFTITFANYPARIGVGASAVDFRKSCQVNVLPRVPRGYSFAIVERVHEGFASVVTGATATTRNNFYYKGQSQSAYASHTLRGPFDGAWQTSDVMATPVWWPCGIPRNLNINSEVRVAAGTSDPKTTTSFIALESAVYHLAWMRCPG